MARTAVTAEQEIAVVTGVAVTAEPVIVDDRPNV